MRRNCPLKIAGIICEYNPFHNGHLRHIQLTREKSGCDRVICCMGGSFTQRGEMAIADKFLRAEMALRCGADAVIELPALYCVRTADVFASAGVQLLTAAGANILSFGSEITDISTLRTLAEMRENEPETVSAQIQDGLRSGKSHARARGEAWSTYMNLDTNRPNSILAVEYIRAVQKFSCDMEPLPIQRLGEYHGENLDTFASATAIRRAIRSGDEYRHSIPEPVHSRIKNAAISENIDNLALYCLRTANLKTILGADEGLENRLLEAALESSTLEEVIEKVKCKRYIRARITRLIAASMLGITFQLAKNHPNPEYIRILGYRKESKDLLARMAKGPLKFASRASELRGDEVFELERRATDLWGLSTKDSFLRKAGRDLTQKLLVL